MTTKLKYKKYIVDELGLINSYDTWHGKYKAQN